MPNQYKNQNWSVVAASGFFLFFFLFIFSTVWADSQKRQAAAQKIQARLAKLELESRGRSDVQNLLAECRTRLARLQNPAGATEEQTEQNFQSEYEALYQSLQELQKQLGSSDPTKKQKPTDPQEKFRKPGGSNGPAPLARPGAENPALYRLSLPEKISLAENEYRAVQAEISRYSGSETHRLYLAGIDELKQARLTGDSRLAGDLLANANEKIAMVKNQLAQARQTGRVK